MAEYARLVAAGLSGEFEVTVLTARHRRALAAEETVDGIRIVRASTLVHVHKGYLSIDFVRRFRSLSRATDLVNLHVPMFEAGLLARLMPAKVPLLVTFQCDLEIAAGWVDRLAVLATRRSARAAIARAQAVIVSSQDYARGSPIVADVPDKTFEIFPPVKPLAWDVSRPSKRMRRVGFLGRHVAEKGLDVLLDAIPLVHREAPDTEFVLAGERREIAGGGIASTMDARLAALPNVRLPGSIDESALAAFYASLDVLVLPSVNAYEAFGLVQVEAMMAGVPVVASDRRGVRVPVQQTGAGILVKPGAPAALAAGILEALRRDWDRPAIARRTAAVFSTARTVAGYRDLALRLVQNRPGTRGIG